MSRVPRGSCSVSSGCSSCAKSQVTPKLAADCKYHITTSQNDTSKQAVCVGGSSRYVTVWGAHLDMSLSGGAHLEMSLCGGHI